MAVEYLAACGLPVLLFCSELADSSGPEGRAGPRPGLHTGRARAGAVLDGAQGDARTGLACCLDLADAGACSPQFAARHAANACGVHSGRSYSSSEKGRMRV